MTLTPADIARLRSYKPGARTVEPESVPPQVEARALRREDFEGAITEAERFRSYEHAEPWRCEP